MPRQALATCVLCGLGWWASGGCTLKLSFDDQNAQATRSAQAVADANVSASVGRLTQLLQSNDPQVRSISADELGALGPKARDATPELTRLLTDPDRHVRFAAAHALAQIDPSDRATVPTLVLVVNDAQTSAEDRRAAIAQLGEMGAVASSARPALVRVEANSVDDDTRAAARAAIDRIDLSTSNLPTVARPTSPAASGGAPVTSSTTPTTRPSSPSLAAPPPQPSGSRINGGATDDVASRTAAAVYGPPGPATQPTRQHEATPMQVVINATGKPAAAGDAVPPPDLRTGSIPHYSPQQLQALRDWIHQQSDLSPSQQEANIRRFEEWNHAQELKASAPGGEVAEQGK